MKDIILSLPAYKAGSPRSKNLLQALLTAAEHTYESESKEDKGDVLLTYTRHLMSLASFVAREKGLTGTSPIVRFWSPHKLPTALADHLDEAPRLFVFGNVLSAYDAIPARDLKAEISTQVRKSLVTACVPLFSVSLGNFCTNGVQVQGLHRSVRWRRISIHQGHGRPIVDCSEPANR